MQGRSLLSTAAFGEAPEQEEIMKRSIALMLLSMFTLAMLAACNTIAGAGKDVQKAGEKVEDAARR